MGRIAVGRVGEATEADSVRAIVAELVCTFLFVFAGVGSAMAVGNYFTLQSSSIIKSFHHHEIIN